MTTFLAALMERSVQDTAVLALMSTVLYSAAEDFKLLKAPYQRTDVSRNRYVQAFMQHSTDPNDVLVMLDCDHNHPQDVVGRLVAHGPKVGVVGALYYKRGIPWSPCFMFRGADGKLHDFASWESDAKLIAGTVVGTGAIAIRRWVFEALEKAGHHWPFFQYFYPEGSQNFPTEDVYFGVLCEAVGIPHYCDVTLVTPHLRSEEIVGRQWQQWLREHPGDKLPADVIGHGKADNLQDALKSLAEDDMVQQTIFKHPDIITRLTY